MFTKVYIDISTQSKEQRKKTFCEFVQMLSGHQRLSFTLLKHFMENGEIFLRPLRFNPWRPARFYRATEGS